jgi:prevent-host-death family protein
MMPYFNYTTGIAKWIGPWYIDHSTMKVSKSELKPKLFSYLRKVSETGKELVITEHGKPVLKIIPVTESDEDPLSSLIGMVDHYDEPLEPVGVLWKAAEPRE